MSSLTLELSQKTPKDYVFEQIFKHFLNFEPLPPLISGLNSKFDYAPYVFLIEDWLAKISFQNLISIKSYRGKTFGGVGSTPLDQEGLKADVTRCNFPCNLSHDVGRRNPLQVAEDMLYVAT